MKKSELQSLIKEEIHKIIKESGYRGQSSSFRPDYVDDGDPKNMKPLSKIKNYIISTPSSKIRLNIDKYSGYTSITASSPGSYSLAKVVAFISHQKVLKLFKDAGWIKPSDPEITMSNRKTYAYYEMTSKLSKLLKDADNTNSKKRAAEIENAIASILSPAGHVNKASE